MHVYVAGLICVGIIYLIGIIAEICLYFTREELISCPTNTKLTELFFEKSSINIADSPLVLNLWGLIPGEEELFNGNNISLNIEEYLNKELIYSNETNVKDAYKEGFSYPYKKIFTGIVQFPEDLHFRHFILQVDQAYTESYIMDALSVYSKHPSKILQKLKCLVDLSHLHTNITNGNISKSNLNYYLIRIQYEYAYKGQGISPNDHFQIKLRVLNKTKKVMAFWYKIYSEIPEVDYSQYLFNIGLVLLLYLLAKYIDVLVYNHPAQVINNTPQFNKNIKYFVIIITAMLLLEYPLKYVFKMLPYAEIFYPVTIGILIGIAEAIYQTIEIFFLNLCKFKSFWWVFGFWAAYCLVLIIAGILNAAQIFNMIFMTLPILIGIMTKFTISSLKLYIPCALIAILHSILLSTKYETGVEGGNLFLFLLNLHSFGILTSKTTPLNIWYFISLIQLIFTLMFLQYILKIQNYLKTEIYFWLLLLAYFCSLFVHDYYMVPQHPRQFPYDIRGTFMAVFAILITCILGVLRGEFKIIYYGLPFTYVYTQTREGRKTISIIDYYIKNYKYRKDNPPFLINTNENDLIFLNKLLIRTKTLKTELGFQSYWIQEGNLVCIAILNTIEIFNYKNNIHISTITLKKSTSERATNIIHIKGNKEFLIATNLRIFLINIGLKRETAISRPSSQSQCICSFISPNIVFIYENNRAKDILRVYFPSQERKNKKYLKAPETLLKIYGINENSFIASSTNKIYIGNFLTEEIYRLEGVPQTLIKNIHYTNNKLVVIFPLSVKIWRVVQGDLQMIGELNNITFNNVLVVSEKLFLVNDTLRWKKPMREIFYQRNRIIDLQNNKAYLNMPIDYDLSNFQPFIQL